MKKSVTEGVKSGGGLAEAALACAIALDDPETPPGAKAALARELRMLILAIAKANNTVVTGDDLDELARRRESRLGGTK